jgi:hypothetical protein
MNVRIISVVILFIAFLLSIGSLASIPQDVWSSIPTYELIIISFNFLVGLATVLVAYWVYADYEKSIRTNGMLSDSIRGEIKRLGEIVDGNFDMVFKRLEKIEETHKKEEKQEKEGTT